MTSDKLFKRQNEKGVALITLLFFVLIATLYISAAVIILGINSLSAAATEQGFTTSRIAEGALEDTLLRLLRNPNYTGGSFNLDGGNVTVNITGTTTKDITVAVINGNYLRRFQAQVTFNQTEMSIVSWKEIF